MNTSGPSDAVTRILFVCTGNICRSPTAEGVARAMAAARGLETEFEFDSAGVEGFHTGEAPDRRARERAALRGYDLSSLRARHITAKDFEAFDLILAMDREHFDELERRCPKAQVGKLKMFADVDVPDPYYGKTSDFDLVLDMCEDAVLGLLGVER